jgi:hypothetical protein
MSKPMVRIHDCETNEVIDREMNEAEIAQYEVDKAASLQHQAEIETNASAKVALLERLGITEDEAKLLLS